MARFLGFIRRHDLVAFPLITFALGWLFYIPGALVIAGHPERYGWLVFFQTPGAAAALVAGLLVRYARGGRAEVRDGWRRYLDWRGHDWWWWLSAVMLIPLLAVGAALAHGSYGPGLLDMWGRLGWFTLLLLPLILVVQLASSSLLNSSRGSMVGPMLLHAGLNLSMAVIAPDTWWLAVLTLAAAAIVAVIVGPTDLGGCPRVTLPPVDEPPRRDPLG